MNIMPEDIIGGYLLNKLLLEHHIRNVDIMMDRPTYLMRDREGWSCPKQCGHDRIL